MTEVNGQGYQLATLRAKAASNGAEFTFKTIKKVMYKVKVPKKPDHDQQGQIDSFTFDKEDIEASFTIKLSEFFRFRKFLFQQNPNSGLLQCQFDFPISFGNSLPTTKTDTLGLCMLNEYGPTAEDGQDNLVIECPFFFMPSVSTWADGPPMVYDQQ